MVVDMRLGKDAKLAHIHKEGSSAWTYSDGQLSHSLFNAPPYVLNASETLVLANLLQTNYSEIVKIARNEQRKDEAAKERKLWGNHQKKL